MDSSPTPDPADRPGSQPDEVLALLADDMEKAFNAIGRSLTNNETAAVYARTLALVEHTLRGAAATGIVTEQQRQAIAELIDGMAQAPRFL
jgi:HPt (histidine-containing phosphotransfer) domain-containing protein